MLIFKYFHFISNNPLSRFPQGGKACLGAPSPVGEGWEGVITIQQLSFYS